MYLFLFGIRIGRVYSFTSGDRRRVRAIIRLFLSKPTPDNVYERARAVVDKLRRTASMNIISPPVRLATIRRSRFVRFALLDTYTYTGDVRVVDAFHGRNLGTRKGAIAMLRFHRRFQYVVFKRAVVNRRKRRMTSCRTYQTARPTNTVNDNNTNA